MTLNAFSSVTFASIAHLQNGYCLAYLSALRVQVCSCSPQSQSPRRQVCFLTHARGLLGKTAADAVEANSLNNPGFNTKRPSCRSAGTSIGRDARAAYQHSS